MKFSMMLETAAKAFAGLKMGGQKQDPRLAALDRGVLSVGLLVAALDGNILPEEFATFDFLARKCRGGSAKNVRETLESILPTVGRLVAMAQIGVYSEKERVDAFVKAALELMPGGFEDGSMLDIRRAFALWVAMGLSDGGFDGIERKAVDALRRRFSALSIVHAREDEAHDARCKQLSPAHVVAYRDTAARKSNRLEPGFIDLAERKLMDFASAAKRDQAAASLEKLVTSDDPA